jgi:hypothetical protein
LPPNEISVTALLSVLGTMAEKNALLAVSSYDSTAVIADRESSAKIYLRNWSV